MTTSERSWIVRATIVYLIAIVLVLLLLNVPGQDVPFFAVIAAGAALCSLRSSRVVRIWSLAATLMVLVLLVSDYRCGVKFQKAMQQAAISRSTNEAAN